MGRPIKPEDVISKTVIGYSVVQMGRQGQQVHAAKVTRLVYRNAWGREETLDGYDCVCNVVNTHNINHWPQPYSVFKPTEPVTCKRCLYLMSRKGITIGPTAQGA